MKKVLMFALILNIFAVQSANALFGSECKKPKASYSSEILAADKYKRLAYNFTAAEKKAFESKLKAAGEKNYKYCLSKKLLTKSECLAMKDIYGLFDTSSRMVRTEYETKMNLSLDTAYRIVLNNQKCFDPTLVVKAQRALGK